jgi:hypothetical protein
MLQRVFPELSEESDRNCRNIASSYVTFIGEKKFRKLKIRGPTKKLYKRPIANGLKALNTEYNLLPATQFVAWGRSTTLA